VSEYQTLQKQKEFKHHIEDAESRNREQVAQIEALILEKEELLRELGAKASRIRVSAFHGEEKRLSETEQLTQEFSDVSEKLSSYVRANGVLQHKISKAKLKVKALQKKCQAFESAVRSLQDAKSEKRFKRDRNCATAADTARRIHEFEDAVERAREDALSKRSEIERLTETVGQLESAMKERGREMDDLRKEKAALTAQLDKEET
jgi:chromosome segregation ATPase